MRISREIIFLFQGFNPNKTKLASPHDSTQGVGPGFYWFGAIVLLIVIIGVVKAFWSDKEWRGRFLKTPRKKHNS